MKYSLSDPSSRQNLHSSFGARPVLFCPSTPSALRFPLGTTSVAPGRAVRRPVWARRTRSFPSPFLSPVTGATTWLGSGGVRWGSLGREWEVRGLLFAYSEGVQLQQVVVIPRPRRPRLARFVPVVVGFLPGSGPAPRPEVEGGGRLPGSCTCGLHGVDAIGLAPSTGTS